MSTQKQALQLDLNKVYKLEEAVSAVKSVAKAKFDESVDISLHIGVDPRKMMVRGVCPMPQGLGKTVKIAVFAKGEAAAEAEAAGADRVGAEDLVKEISDQPWAGYDVVLATPDTMPLVSRLAKKLGPKGLMPNPKLGTVTTQLKKTIEQSKAGQAKFRVDKAGIIHCGIGKVSFSDAALLENLEELIKTIKKLKPAASKGQYLKKLYMTTTMGPCALKVDLSTFV